MDRLIGSMILVSDLCCGLKGHLVIHRSDLPSLCKAQTLCAALSSCVHMRCALPLNSMKRHDGNWSGEFELEFFKTLDRRKRKRI